MLSGAWLLVATNAAATPAGSPQVRAAAPAHSPQSQPAAPQLAAPPLRAWPALQTYSVSRLLPFRTEARLPQPGGDPPLPSLEAPDGPQPGTAMVLTRRREPRLMKIGGLLLGIGYAPALALALALAPQAGEPGAPSPATNYTLLVPVVGPLVSGVLAPAGAAPGTAYGAVTTWTLPLVLTLGLAQSTGFALLTTGAIPRLRPTTTTSDPLDVNFPPWKTR